MCIRDRSYSIIQRKKMPNNELIVVCADTTAAVIVLETEKKNSSEDEPCHYLRITVLFKLKELILAHKTIHPYNSRYAGSDGMN